jgi:lipid-A-disaccharide synthase
LIKVNFANLVNIMHNSVIVPELLQQNCTPDKLASAIRDLLTDDDIRQKQIAGLATVANWLGQGKFVPSERAAETVMQVVQNYKVRV